ncbi:calcium-dependent phosphotriesterase [Acephala macrosclerotiorum]|nr:calcium-dependent phosphotriesterase [Acephala macrosclerotiorum]
MKSPIHLRSSLVTAALAIISVTTGQNLPPGVISPLVQTCGPTSNIACINHYASVMPYHFYREASDNASYEDTFPSTTVGNDSSFSLLKGADFLVFDHDRGLEMLGSSPSYEYMFAVNDAVHEAPVYSPVTNKLYLSQLRGKTSPPGFLPQLVVNLNVEPPYLGELLSDPPIYAPNGGTLHNGLIYWGVSGGSNSVGGIEERPGIATLDPTTNKTVTLLNNYFGHYFNTVDDLFVDDKGDVWFTDPQYSWFNALTDTAPQLNSASYRFRPSTGVVSMIDDTMVQPNGIAISPRLENCSATENRKVYITDSGAVTGSILQSLGSQGTGFNSTGKRTVYAFDLTPDGNYITNRRPVWFAQDFIPDGLKVARNGWIVAGTGTGVDIVDPDDGALIVRIQTNFTVQNFAWAGSDYMDFWLMGKSGIARVKWNLQGQELK